MTKYEAQFDTRLLYKQNYTADENISVFSCTYAIMWGIGSKEPLTTSRLRLTMLFTKESLGIQPVQGLIEQWKQDGWQVLDEFVDLNRDFVSQETFEEHLIKMARSFLLGIPIESEIVSEDDQPSPFTPSSKKTSLPSSRIEKLMKKETSKKNTEDIDIKDSDDDNITSPEGNISEESDNYINDVKNKESNSEKPEIKDEDSSNEESEDDDWV